MSIYNIPTRVKQYMMEYMDAKSQLNFKNCCKQFRNRLYVTKYEELYQLRKQLDKRKKHESNIKITEPKTEGKCEHCLRDSRERCSSCNIKLCEYCSHYCFGCEFNYCEECSDHLDAL